MEKPMISRRFARSTLFSFMASVFAIGPVHADSHIENFAVMRGDDQIGTNTISLERNGLETNVQIVTHVAVKALFLTLYHFDLTETEHWLNGRLLAMTSDTNDNGTIYKTNANNSGTTLLVQNGSGEKRVAASTVPISLWNEALLGQSEAIDPKNGNIVPLKVVDRGLESLVIGGHTVRAHHYLVTTTFSQDVWYDSDNRFLKLQMKASDGSTIRYQRV